MRIRAGNDIIADMKQERLYSLDLLRGLDMFLLTVIGPFFAAPKNQKFVRVHHEETK